MVKDMNLVIFIAITGLRAKDCVAWLQEQIEGKGRCEL